MTAYRCRSHTDEQVSWRGTGCRECAREQRGPKRHYGDADTAHEPLLDVFGLPLRLHR